METLATHDTRAFRTTTSTRQPTNWGPMASKRKQRMKLHHRDGVAVMDLGPIEIWDGADLSLLRDTLAGLIEVDGCRSIGVEMTSVKYIPSGFFGMLFDWHECGVEMRLYGPQPNVANMLWFRKFFDHEGNGVFRLQADRAEELAPPIGGWPDETDWDDDESTTDAAQSFAAGSRR